MANYKEIVTKAVIAKGKKLFTSNHEIVVNNKPSTILGVWVINHNFHGVKNNEVIKINGSFDVNIWYSYDNDTKTEVVRETNQYSEIVRMRDREDSLDEEIIVRSLKQPNCIKVEINGDKINYLIEKELGIELVGDVKVKVQADEDEDPWDEILEESNSGSEENIDDKVNEEYLTDGI
jgi:spore coat protein E